MLNALLAAAVTAAIPLSVVGVLWLLFESSIRPGHWIIEAWRKPPAESDLGEPVLPGGSADFAMSVALVELQTQDQQVNAIDSKLGMLLGASVTVVVVLPAVIATATKDGHSLAWTLAWMGFGGFVIALSHALRGLSIRRWAAGPELAALRDQFFVSDQHGWTSEQIKWASVVAIERDIRNNDRAMRPKAAALRVSWGAVSLASIATVLSSVLSLTQ